MAGAATKFARCVTGGTLVPSAWGTSTDRSFGHDPVDIRLALVALLVHSGFRWSGS